MSLEVPEFKLNAVKELSRLQLDAAKTRSQLASEAVDRLKKMVQIERDATKLAHLKDLYGQYIYDLRRNRKQIRDANRECERIEDSVNRAAHLFLGESATPTQVQQGWRAFFYLVSQFMLIPLVDSISASDARMYNPRSKSLSSVIPGPALHVFAEARARNLVPYIGSEIQDRLVDIFRLLNQKAGEFVSQKQEDLRHAEQELSKLRKEGNDYFG